MFRKSESSIIDFQKGKSFDNYQVKKDIIVKNNYHGTKAPLAKVTAQWDYVKMKELDERFKNQWDLSNDITNKGEEIKATIDNALQQSLNVEVKAQESLIISQNAFKLALRHDCIYEIESIKNGIYIIKFIPFSTSKNTVLCGVQEFKKIAIPKSSVIYIQFYITRILYRKKMTKEEFITWEAGKNSWYQDMALRKNLFDLIQKDLDNNDYSILSEEDLLNPKVEFLTKELPRVKFKFTDLVE